MKSYDDYGLVNREGPENLPGRIGIEEILCDLDYLLFPGYRGEAEQDHPDLRQITGERASRLADNLICETEKSIGFVAGMDRGQGRAAAEIMVEEFFDELPHIRSFLSMDLEAAFRGDPSAKTPEDIILSYPGFQAIAVYRAAHFLWNRHVPLIPRMMSEAIHGRTGIDIHPGAEIGGYFFIDHGTGVVIGETAVIGKNVKICQGVTLGALSVKKEEALRKRHPTIEDDVVIYANTVIMGGKTTIGRGSVIGGCLWITESVPPGSRIFQVMPPAE